MTEQHFVTREGAETILRLALVTTRNPAKRRAIRAALDRHISGQPICLCAACERARRAK